MQGNRFNWFINIRRGSVKPICFGGSLPKSHSRKTLILPELQLGVKLYTMQGNRFNGLDSTGKFVSRAN